MQNFGWDSRNVPDRGRLLAYLLNSVTHNYEGPDRRGGSSTPPNFEGRAFFDGNTAFSPPSSPLAPRAAGLRTRVADSGKFASSTNFCRKEKKRRSRRRRRRTVIRGPQSLKPGTPKSAKCPLVPLSVPESHGGGHSNKVVERTAARPARQKNMADSLWPGGSSWQRVAIAGNVPN